MDQSLLTQPLVGIILRSLRRPKILSFPYGRVSTEAFIRE